MVGVSACSVMHAIDQAQLFHREVGVGVDQGNLTVTCFVFVLVSDGSGKCAIIEINILYRQ